MPFDIGLTVPAGTADGVYTFGLDVVGDGAVYATMAVTITVVNEIEVPVDIKPGSCPNPFNVKLKGVLPVAVCGTGELEVTRIDPATVKLCGVPVLRWSYEDVATPWLPYVDKPLDPLSCHTLGGDGLTDLGLKFDGPAVAAALGSVTDREVRALPLTGALKPEFDGTDIVGEDVVILLVR